MVTNNLENKLSTKDIFKDIWWQPRKVFKYILAARVDEYVTLLLILVGIVRGFDRAISKSLGDNLSLGAVIGFSVLGGAISGWIGYHIYAYVLSYTGKLLGGSASKQEILRVLAYAGIPNIITLAVIVLQIAVFDIALFKSEEFLEDFGLVGVVFYTGLSFVEIVFSVWTLVLIVVGISEVQKMTISKAILNVLLPILIFGLVLFMIGFSFSSI